MSQLKSTGITPPPISGKCDTVGESTAPMRAINEQDPIAEARTAVGIDSVAHR
jgi:hypothetical protein